MFGGGGGGGDLLTFSAPCLETLSVAGAAVVGLVVGRSTVAGLGACSVVAGLLDFSRTGLGSFSGPGLAGMSVVGSGLGSSTGKQNIKIPTKTTFFIIRY